VKIRAAAGTAVVMSVPDSASDVDIAVHALQFGLAPAPLTPSFMNPPRQQGLLLGVTNLNERTMVAHCRRLVELVHGS
jgi:GntR family transcriptional regulator/MocR family aminotransferase